MIDADLIKQNIPEIKEENIPAIVELVNNTFTKELETAETNGFGEGRKDAFNKIDEVVKKHGFPRTSGLTSVHYDNVLTTLAEQKMDEKTTKRLTELERLNKEYSEQIKNGNPDFAQKEKDLLGKIELLNGQLSEKDKLITETQESNKKALIRLQIESKMPKVKESVSDITVELHKNKALEQMIEFADFDDNKNVIFRDDTGAVKYNQANKNNPFSIDDMWRSNDFFKPIIDEGRKQTGLGSKDKGGQPKTFTLNVTGAKNQVEADDIIRDYVSSTGLSIQSPEFHDKVAEIRKENKVQELPLT